MKFNRIVVGLSVISALSIAATVMALTQSEVCTDGDPNCVPAPAITGAHGVNAAMGTPTAHGGYACAVCHKVGGLLVFDKNGPAYAAGKPAPAFDASAKTCSNIACHSIAPSTFSYYFPDGTGEAQLITVNVLGNAGGVTPSWYSTGAAACGACHGNPPRSGTDGSNVWHSGYHGGEGPSGAYNQCQFCHSDATGSNGQGTAITNPVLHANGTINVQAKFTSACFNCH